MARKKEAEQPAAGSPLWMTTFSDMMTLLLCFFVLLYSMSTIDAEKWQKIVIAFTGNPDIFTYYNSVIDGKGIDDPNAPEYEEEDFESAGKWDMVVSEVTNELKGLEDELGLNEIIIEASDTEIVINLEGDLLFDLGKDVLRTEAQELLLNIVDRVVLPFTASYKEIRIEGHTDRVPISSTRFPNNQYLSAARAISAANFILANYPEIPENMVGYIGYGETRPKVDTDVQNVPANRRVALVLIKDPAIEAQIRQEQQEALQEQDEPVPAA